MLGLYYLQIKNYNQAVQVLSSAAELAPNKQIALIYLAKAYALNNDLQNAMKYYERAIAITPANISAYNQTRMEYVQLLLLANQDQKALVVIRDMMPTASREEFNTLVSQMMQVYTQRKDLNSLARLLSEANQVDPNNQNFVLWLAQAYVAGGDYQTAVLTINKLSSTNPSMVTQFNQELQAYILKKQQEAK
jgi:tetratricopeptide (TPR) repeat protein